METKEFSIPGIHTVNVDGQSIRYEVTGEGSPLILMHGWGCSLETVRSIAAVASKNHKVFNLDFPGFGSSPEPPSVWGVEEYAALIENFARLLNIENPVLIGHSFGGRVGILFSSRNPVSKLILVDAAGIKPKRPLKYYFRIYSFKMFKNFVKLLYKKEKAEKIINDYRSRRGSADYNSASPRMKQILSKVVNEDLTNKLESIKAPTLLVWGENDTATPLKDAKLMERLIPNAGLVSFKNAGHYSFLDSAYAFGKVLSSFLNSQE